MYTTIYNLFRKLKPLDIEYIEDKVQNWDLYKGYAKIMIARNPISRLESVYKDKIVNCLQVRNLQINQDCQKLLKSAISKNISLDKLTFCDMTNLLPKIYYLDPHLIPQNQIMIDRYSNRVSLTELIKIESNGFQERLLIWLNQMLGTENRIETLKKENSTAHISTEIKYKSDTLDLIKQLYFEDFLYLDY